MKKRPTTSETKLPKSNRYPPGWNEKRVKEVIAYYDQQSEDDELAEYEGAMQIKGQSVMLVPTDLVREIRRLIKRHRGA